MLCDKCFIDTEIKNKYKVRDVVRDTLFMLIYTIIDYIYLFFLDYLFYMALLSCGFLTTYYSILQ